MLAREKKTVSELTALIMQEVRKHTDWNDIVNVGIIRPLQSAPHHPNWDAAFTMDGQRIPPEKAFRLITELQTKYDLA